MKGAVIGDIIGSVYEGTPVKKKDFELFPAGTTFTDDTVLTIAVADAILTGKSYKESLHQYGRRYPNRGYGGMFRAWIMQENPQPYNSFGNGSAMRVSPVGFAFESEDTVMKQAASSAVPSHNHPEGIKGAQATARCIWLARKGESREAMKELIGSMFDYDLDRKLDEIRPGYRFDATCQGTVPEAIISFLESADYEDAVRNAISLGGDSDTLACITGSIAEAYYGKIPEEIEQKAMHYLDEALRNVLKRFYTKTLRKND